MPYHLIVPHMFAKTPRLGEDGLAGTFFKYYEESSTPYATTAVIDCSKLEDLAEIMARVVEGKDTEIAALNIANMQTYYRYTYQTTVDLRDFAYALHG